MPIFRVKKRVDAWVDYYRDVEADTAADAAEAAFDQDRYGPTPDWGEGDTPDEFDAALYVALDENGDEIDGTQQGDF